MRLQENHNYKIYDTLGIKLLKKLGLSFSHLNQPKFGHNFADTINPFVHIMFLFLRNFFATYLTGKYYSSLKKTTLHAHLKKLQASKYIACHL